MSPTPTGYYRDGRIVIERLLAFGTGEAWDALTASDRTARWIGPWSGDPSAGVIDLTMTAEEGSPTMPLRIDECESPVRVAVSAGEGDDVWTLFGEVRSAGEGEVGSVIALSQVIDDPEKASAVGMGVLPRPTRGRRDGRGSRGDRLRRLLPVHGRLLPRSPRISTDEHDGAAHPNRMSDSAVMGV